MTKINKKEVMYEISYSFVISILSLLFFGVTLLLLQVLDFYLMHPFGADLLYSSYLIFPYFLFVAFVRLVGKKLNVQKGDFQIANWGLLSISILTYVGLLLPPSFWPASIFAFATLAVLINWSLVVVVRSISKIRLLYYLIFVGLLYVGVMFVLSQVIFGI